MKPVCERCSGAGGWNDFPMHPDGSYRGCPLCGRVYCDHKPKERGDSGWQPCPDCRPEEYQTLRLHTMPADDEALRRRCERVVPEDTIKPDEVLEHIAAGMALGRQMISIMAQKGGIGLAAPQVGSRKRVIVVSPQCWVAVEDSGLEHHHAPDEPLILIDPVPLRSHSDEEVQVEGCLSLPGKFGLVSRPRHAIFEYRAPDGRTLTGSAFGLTGRCLLHEMDHLDGVLISDKWEREWKLEERA